MRGADPRATVGVACVALLAAAAFVLRLQAVGDPARGRLLFERGVDARGIALTGRLEPGGARLAGAAAACARCHGAGGEGTREGGIEAPPIDARTLATASARRPALDDDALIRAIAIGRLPDGTRLDPAMPRYALEPRDARDLVAWLRALGETLDPGVDDDAVRIGVLERGAAAAEVRAILEAFFAERGAIHGRRVEIVAVADDRSLLDEAVFALAGGGLPRDPAVRARLERDGVPIVAPIGPRQPELETIAFHLYPTAEELARIAVQQLLGAGRRPVVLHRADAEGRAWRAGARAEAARRGGGELRALAWESGALDPAAAARFVREAEADVAIFAGGWDELLAIDRALAATSIDAELHAPIGLAGAAPAGARWPARVRLWSPTLLGGTPDPGFAAFEAFLRRHGHDARRSPAQHHAWAAGRLLLEGLRLAGSPPTRARLVRALESLRDFPTGVTPPITWGRYRRSGVRGAFLLRFDPTTGALARDGGWTELAPY